jgi:hypothetical protein
MKTKLLFITLSSLLFFAVMGQAQMIPYYRVTDPLVQLVDIGAGGYGFPENFQAIKSPFVQESMKFAIEIRARGY